jgi:uroporphyrin-3 C-methyltransferase
VNSPEDEVEFDPFEHDPVKKGKSGKSSGSVAWLALLFGLIAIAFNAWQWWQDQVAEPGDLDRQQAIDKLDRTQSGFQQSLEALQSRLSNIEQRDDSDAVTAIRFDIKTLQSGLSELDAGAAGDRALVEAVQVMMMELGQRISDIETSVTAMAVRSDTPGQKMDLAEIDYLLRLAGERLALFGDVKSADRALGLADGQLEALDDPLYLAVRRGIGEARQALKNLPAPDLVSLSGQIASLQAAIPSLAFPGETPVEEPSANQLEGGWWQRIKNTLAPLVKVRRRVNEDLELSLEDKDYLRQGLWLQLESARLALMRNDARAWDLSLAKATESIEQRFDVATGPVQDALSGLEQLQGTALVQEMPDIGAPWRQLQLLRGVESASGGVASGVPGRAAIQEPPDITTTDSDDSDPADQAEEDGDPQG